MQKVWVCEECLPKLEVQYYKRLAQHKECFWCNVSNRCHLVSILRQKRRVQKWVYV